MDRLYHIDKLLARNLAADSENTENTIATEQFWMVIHAFERKIEQYTFEELVLIKNYFLFKMLHQATDFVDLNRIFIHLVEKQMKKLR